jgi:hypothetical protein
LGTLDTLRLDLSGFLTAERADIGDARPDGDRWRPLVGELGDFTERGATPLGPVLSGMESRLEGSVNVADRLGGTDMSVTWNSLLYRIEAVGHEAKRYQQKRNVGVYCSGQR